MLARTQVLAFHSASDKLLHYVRLRVHEALLNQTYRAGLFVPASQLDSILFDLALIYDAIVYAKAADPGAESHFASVCTAAAEELRGQRSEIGGPELAARAVALHERHMQGAGTLGNLTVSIEAALLRPLSARGELSKRQRQLRHDLALVLSLEAQVVRSSALGALGVEVDLSTLVDDRDQHLFLFCDRYGCLNKSELGEDLDLIEDEEHEDTHRVPNAALKRAVDVLGAAAILLMLSPVFLFLVAAIKLEGGPAFYNQRRVGRHGRVFRCWKFRTMVPNAEQLLEEILATDAEAQAEYAQFFKLRKDPRITRIGRTLRKTSLDELPQLYNILIGDMSLVGPRPILVNQRPLYPGALYGDLRPGITGLWQVTDRHLSAFTDRARLDRVYAEQVSLRTDVLIMFRTVRPLVAGTGC
jgi:exopolysaccharide production protein ExoY